MQKIVGSILVILAGTCIGFLKGNDMTERVRHMQEIKRIFHAMEQEITYTRVPLCQAFERIAHRCRVPFSNWLISMSEMLERREEGPIQEIWNCCVWRHLKSTRLSTEDIEVISYQGVHMGQLDTKMQSAAICLFLEQWEERIVCTTQQLESKRRLARCIGILGSIFLVILLL